MWSLPNLFTFLRLALTPPIVWAILERRHYLAIELFAGAALTDVIDGGLARRFGWTSTWGAYLDPVADKVLLSSVYLALAAIESVPWWLVILIFGRDLLILAAVGLALRFTQYRRFQPSVWGKASTFFQILAAVSALARNALGGPALDHAASALVWPAAAATVWSGIHYGWRFRSGSRP